MNTIILYSVVIMLLLVSWHANQTKTKTAFKQGMLLFARLLPSLLSVLMLVSLSLALIGTDILLEWMGPDAGFTGFVTAASAGAIVMIPPFVAFPMAELLINAGICIPVIAVFVTSLMMVGIATLPLEASFFGWTISLTRNLLSFFGAIFVGSGIALLWGLF